MLSIRTENLEIAYEGGGPEDGAPLILLHGWPEVVGGWRQSAALLHACGWRTFAPYLRGSGPTRSFSARDSSRRGGVALAQDPIDLADALKLDTFAVAGRGARAAYILAAPFPERVTGIVGVGLAYQPRGAFSLPSFSQARRFWYQSRLCRRCRRVQIANRKRLLTAAPSLRSRWLCPGRSTRTSSAITVKSYLLSSAHFSIDHVHALAARRSDNPGCGFGLTKSPI